MDTMTEYELRRQKEEQTRNEIREMARDIDLIAYESGQFIFNFHVGDRYADILIMLHRNLLLHRISKNNQIAIK